MKNKQKLLQKMKIIQKQLREIERIFYYELGVAVEKEIQAQAVTFERVREIYNELKQKYGI
ncbi:hypothetical protein [Thermodesulfovibrio yellowstonii]|uniref:Uncharacterized protein n=1 Tax=Thermodesulfovibrio yellowstonii TaxID=28262 RepID=A0A9W6GG79_9BACT|nr:hypothetical protein [Thermodesulfovibrio islandicus]GLI53354.1 hypothetical protein TISLANDTSLP1_10470 [Thermodesulfovibrio islandicus]